jgi:hypothetical protein
MSYNQAGYRNADSVQVIQGQAAVTQASSITTGVTCNAYSGVITTVSQTISAGTFIAAVAAVANGQFTVRLTNLHASASGDAAIVLNFIVLKAVA